MTHYRKWMQGIALLISGVVHGQDADKYLESIRNNTAALTAFFAQMPKGGDLHNHFSGAIYAERYINYVVQQNDVINEQTLEVKTAPPDNGRQWVRFSQLADSGLLPTYKEKLMQKWSVKDYNGVSYPSDKLFFETFPAFSIANKGPGRLDSGLLELKRRAVAEHVSYIETMFTGIPCDIRLTDSACNNQLEDVQKNKDEQKLFKLLDKRYKTLENDGIKECAASFNQSVTERHRRLHIDDSSFTLRYLNYATRILPPARVFEDLALDFESADKCPLIVGVNIVAPENDDVSMRDCWLHMEMFKYLHKKYPKVKYSIHAGELAEGMVKPEELTWHINAAVRIAGADRIGHGVDIPYEADSYDLLRYMAKTDVAVEINLSSNEFILKVKDDAHPISLYKDFGVPIVISSDDPGVLRTSLTQQYVLLAYRYKTMSYQDIKRFVYNSIGYSFIKEDNVRKQLKHKLDNDFRRFERQISELPIYSR